MRVDLRDGTGIRFRHHRVLLNGEEVTGQCFLADEEEGIVGLYLRDASGHFYKHGEGTAQEFRHGVVTFIPPN